MARDTDKKTKTRTETTISWQWNVFDPDQGTHGGLQTILPPNENVPNGFPARPVALVIVSNDRNDGGSILLSFDQPLWAGGANRACDEIQRVFGALYVRRIVDADRATIAESNVHSHFLMGRREGAYCESAIQRAIEMMMSFGVSVHKMGPPDIVQRTFVQRSQAGEVSGWMPFGTHLWEKIVHRPA